MKLSELGLDEWFQHHASKHCESKQTLARVTAVDRGRYTIMDEDGEVFARLTGKFKHSVKKPEDYPVVGDWVCVQHFKSKDTSTIHAKLPRKTTLKRKSAGRRVEYQYIGANIDVVFIVVSCFFDFNIRRLERYLSIVRECGIKPVVLLNKTDLITEEELEIFIDGIKEADLDAEIVPVSCENGNGIDQLNAIILPSKTYCLIGSSGVGKTTIINQLTDETQEELQTGEVMNSGEGRHTTVRRQLVILENGALFIDTPGMREMGVLSAEFGIQESFSDILEIALNCHFSDCTHTKEPKCAVHQAVEDDIITEGHFVSYLMLKDESEENAKSYLARQRRPLSTLKPDPLSKKHKGQSPE